LLTEQGIWPSCEALGESLPQISEVWPVALQKGHTRFKQW